MLPQHKKSVRRLKLLGFLTGFLSILGSNLPALASFIVPFVFLFLCLFFAEGIEVIYKTLERTETTANIITILEVLDDIEDISDG